MRSLLFISLLAIFLVACPRLRKGEAQGGAEQNPTNGWPTGYTTWEKTNPNTLVPEPDETKQIARELYAQKTPNLGIGTILVKEGFAFANGAKGALTEVAVMRRTGTGDHNGWEFLAFDPKTRQRVSANQCISCHIIQEDSDYLFSNLSR